MAATPPIADSGRGVIGLIAQASRSCPSRDAVISVTYCLYALEMLLGLTLLYLAFFLREDEEGKIHNKLAEIWIEIDDRAKNAGSTFQALLKKGALLASEMLERIFGKPLVSIQSFSVSLWLGIWSWLTLYAVGSRSTWPIYWAIFSLIVGALPALTSTKLARAVTATLGLVVVIGCFLGSSHPRTFGPFFLPSGTDLVGIAALGGALIDVFWAIINRKLALAAADSSNASVLTLWALGSTMFAALLWIPFDYVASIPFDVGDASPVHTLGRAVLYGCLSSRLFTSSVSLLTIMAIVILVLHRVIWPLLSRIVYPLQRFGIFRHRKTLGALGGLLLAHQGFIEIVRHLLSA